MTRRRWLAMVGTGMLGSGLLPGALSSRGWARSAHTPGCEGTDPEGIPVLIPPGLRPGALIAITAPASPVRPSELSAVTALLRRWGYRVRLARTVTAGGRYLAAPDQERAQELMELVADPTVDAILCARGGYGTLRMLPYLDWELFRRFPKPIIGFSDITALLLALYSRARVVTYHGPVATSRFDPFTAEWFRRTLALPEALQPWRLSNPQWRVLAPGRATGVLVGGNLSLLVATLGTPYEVDLRGAVLFLEDVGEEPYRVDRMLMQLALAGKLQQCAAVLLGRFRAPWGRFPSGTIGWQPPVEQIFRDYLASLNIPVLAGLPIGHVLQKLTLPIGVRALVDADARTIALCSPSVNGERSREGS
jgi:muramoyltetrapeptide carboxypeptidase